MYLRIISCDIAVKSRVQEENVGGEHPVTVEMGSAANLEITQSRY